MDCLVKIKEILSDGKWHESSVLTYKLMDLFEPSVVLDTISILQKLDQIEVQARGSSANCGHPGCTKHGKGAKQKYIRATPKLFA